MSTSSGGSGQGQIHLRADHPSDVRKSHVGAGILEAGGAHEGEGAVLQWHLARSGEAENGLIIIAEEKAQALADELGYTRDVLDWDAQVYGFGSSSFYHRKQQALPQSRLKQIQATLNLARLRTNLLTKGLDIESSYSFEPFDLDDYKSAEHIARAVRAMWQVPMGPIRDMARLIENAGGVVIRSDFDTHRISAISQWIPGERPIFVSNASMSADRERFSLAHEAAHILMHERPRETQEAEADAFAAEFLMPAAEIRAQLANGVDLGRAAQLKTYWRVSMSAIIRRARDLDCITPRRAKSLYIQMSQQGWLKKEPVEIDRDQIRFLTGVVNAQLHQNGYTVQELSKLTGILPDEFTRLYLPEQQARLSLVTKEQNMAKSSGRSVNRSASTGEFVTKATVARSPGKTVTQHVGGNKTGQTVTRSASTGQFVTKATAKRNPGGTVTEKR